MKRIRLIILLLSCVIFIYSGVRMSLAFGREPGVIYDGKEKSFTFVNTEETDLFREFKDVIPGDVLTQKIKLPPLPSFRPFFNLLSKNKFIFESVN